jgi:hypothetical protein
MPLTIPKTWNNLEPRLKGIADKIYAQTIPGKMTKRQLLNSILEIYELQDRDITEEGKRRLSKQSQDNLRVIYTGLYDYSKFKGKGDIPLLRKKELKADETFIIRPSKHPQIKALKPKVKTVKVKVQQPPTTTTETEEEPPPKKKTVKIKKIKKAPKKIKKAPKKAPPAKTPPFMFSPPPSPELTASGTPSILSPVLTPSSTDPETRVLFSEQSQEEEEKKNKLEKAKKQIEQILRKERRERRKKKKEAREAKEREEKVQDPHSINPIEQLDEEDAEINPFTTSTGNFDPYKEILNPISFPEPEQPFQHKMAELQMLQRKVIIPEEDAVNYEIALELEKKRALKVQEKLLKEKKKKKKQAVLKVPKTPKNTKKKAPKKKAPKKKAPKKKAQKKMPSLKEYTKLLNMAKQKKQKECQDIQKKILAL